MSKRTLDRIATLEKLLVPPPDRWAELARTYFPVPMTVALLHDWHGEVARWRAEAIAQGRVMNPDAKPELYVRNHAECEAYLMAQQAKLIADAQGDVDRAFAREAERIAAERDAKEPPTPQRRPKPSTPFVPVPSVFDTHVRA